MPGKTKIFVDRIHQSSILDHMYPGNAPNQQPQGYSQASQMPPGYPMMPPGYPMMGPHGYQMMPPQAVGNRSVNADASSLWNMELHGHFV